MQVGTGFGGTMGNARGRQRRRLTAAGVTAAAGLLAPALLAAAPARTATAVSPPVPVLRWHTCAGPAGRQGFQCATARVPLDYTDPTGRTIAIAVIRHRATGPGPRLGSLFINYGGPGGQGVADLPPTYHLVPARLRQRFDIVSFDPRGTGLSTAVRCFRSGADEDRLFAGLPAGFPVGPAQTRRWIATFATLGRLCQQRVGWLLPHLATADAARDMDLLRRAAGDPGLNYLGLSYGTYLGATYANLFPGRVRALVLDGAITPTDWARPRRAGGVPLSTLLRTGQDLGMRATLGQFLSLCGRAGPRRCAFSAGTPLATRAKYVTLLRRLRRRPIGTLTYAGLVHHVGSELYAVFPVAAFHRQGWANLARLLQSAWRASGHRPVTGWRAATSGYPWEEQQTAILCADSPNPRAPASYPIQGAFASGRAGAFGPDVTWISEPCATWPARDAHGYYGPWNHPTARPVLVVGNSYDPGTPYPGALGLTRELARARLLTLDGYGHTAFINPSRCVDGYEAEYFVTGALPPPGTVCHQDRQPFG